MDRLRGVGRRVRDRASRRPAGAHFRRGPGVAELRRRVAELESEMQEARRLNRRLAELTDVVQELLLPLSQRDEAKVHEVLDRYSASL
jgi:hypothetical protein